MSHPMNHYSKLQACGTLTALMQAGFVIRGFEGFAATRGSGAKVLALSITREGGAVTDVYEGGGGREGWTVAWVDSDGAERKEVYNVQLSDAGEIRLTPFGEKYPALTVPDKPTWR